MSHTDLDCECVVDHRPANLEPDIHHIVPLSWGGPDTEENEVVNCPNQHRSTHQLLRAYRRAGGDPGWAIRRLYSPFTRRQAATGWAGYLRIKETQ